MHHAIIADDDLQTLHDISAIIKNHLPAFCVDGTFASSETALYYMQEHEVDLLITTMPMHDLSGAILAQKARALYPNLHIVIISSRADFHDAQQAIEAAVDDYLLKPVDAAVLTYRLNRIAARLDAEQRSLVTAFLPILACDYHVEDPRIGKILDLQYRFTLLRWGNLRLFRPEPLQGTVVLPDAHSPFIVLRGRNDQERILLSKHANHAAYLADLNDYLSQHQKGLSTTTIYAPQPRPLAKLHDFIEQSMVMLSDVLVIGKSQILPLAAASYNQTYHTLSITEMKQLDYFIETSKLQRVKDYMLDLADQWEQQNVTQHEAHRQIRYLTHHFAAVIPKLYPRIDELIHDILDSYLCAQSYRELMTNAFNILFENELSPARRLSAQEFYQQITHYIDEQYAAPLNMQRICDEFSISRTHLNRLFRNQGQTTFNAYLTQRRIEQSVTLMREHPEYQLQDIAACVGYEDASYWSKVFRSVKGCSPSQYLMNAQK